MLISLGESAAQTTALIVLTLCIAYLSLVLGELVPKRLALQKPEPISLAVAPVLDRFASLMRPVIWLLSVSANGVVRLLGGDPHVTGGQVSEEQLRELVSTHQDLEEEERRILRDVLAATETTLKEVMRPRGDVEFLQGTLPLTEAAPHVRTLPYSRYPVTGEDFDVVIGFLHVRRGGVAARLVIGEQVGFRGARTSRRSSLSVRSRSLRGGAVLIVGGRPYDHHRTCCMAGAAVAGRPHRQGGHRVVTE